MATVGCVAANCAENSWPVCQRCGVTSKEACHVFDCIEPAMFKLLRSLIVLVALVDKSFVEVCEVLTKQYRLDIVEQLKFHSDIPRLSCG